MSERYKGYRYPKVIIGFAVRYYHCYKLSYRDVSDILLDRGITVSHETLRSWCKVWGPIYAKEIRKKRGYTFSDKWHIDEMCIKINGETYWLWRLIDSHAEEIEILLQKHRNARAAIRFLKKVLKKTKAPRIVITDKLRSYKKAHRILFKSSEPRSHKRLNNLIENSHQATREKERQVRKFKDPGNTQRFLSTMGTMLNLLKIGRYKNTAQEYREKLKAAISTFDDISNLSYDFA